MLRIEEQDLAIGLEGAGGVHKVMLERLPKAKLQVDELRLSNIEIDAFAEDLDEWLPLLGLRVEDVKRGQRWRRGRLVIEHGAVGLDRATDIVELGLIESSDLVLDGLLVGSVHGEITPLLEDPQQVRESAGLTVQPLEGDQRLRVVVLDLAHGAVRLERVVDSANLVDKHAPELKAKGHRQRMVAIRERHVDGLAITADHAIPPAGHVRRTLDVGGRLRVTGHELEGRKVAFEGLLRLLEPCLRKATPPGETGLAWRRRPSRAQA